MVNKTKGFNVVAVSDAFRLAHWADAMCSTDGDWWRENPDHKNFQGLKFSVKERAPDIKSLGKPTNHNSGLLGIRTALHLGARKIILLGFDMSGTHYFGKHKPPLNNTRPETFEIFKRHFAQYDYQGAEILNANLNSSLECFPKVRVKMPNGEYLN